MKALILQRAFPPIRLLTLMISLLILISIYPIYDRNPATYNKLMSLVLLASLYFVSESRRSFLAALVLGLPYLGIVWLSDANRSQYLSMIALTSGLVFIVFTIVRVIRHILRAKQVDADILYGAVSVYLLFGFAWTFAYGLVELLFPGSLTVTSDLISSMGSADANVDEPIWGDILYFSFVTLTTLGYGDISPVAGVAKSLAILEAVTGVLYTATLIARLVGIYTTQAITKEEATLREDLSKTPLEDRPKPG